MPRVDPPQSRAGRLHCRFCHYSLPDVFMPRLDAAFDNPHDALSWHVTTEHFDLLTATEKKALLPNWTPTYGRSQCPKCLSICDEDGRCLNCDREARL